MPDEDQSNHRQQEGDRLFAGVDWGGSFHQLCVLNTTGQVLMQQRINHTPWLVCRCWPPSSGSSDRC